MAGMINQKEIQFLKRNSKDEKSFQELLHFIEKIRKTPTKTPFNKIGVQKLAESESRYRNLVKKSPLAIIIHQNGKVVYANESAKKVIGGKSKKQLIGTPVLSVIPPEDRPMIIERIRKQAKTGKTVPLAEERWIRFDGSTIYVEVIAMPISWNGKMAYQVVAQDVSELKLHRLLIDKMNEATLSKTGDLFLQELVHSICSILHADMAYVGRYLPDENAIRTEAVWKDGAKGDELYYNLIGTPCSKIIGKSIVIIRDEVAEKYPQDTLLAELNLKAYIGCPLFDPAGKPSGIIVSLFRQPITKSNINIIKTVFSLYAVRAGAELERQKILGILQSSEDKFKKTFKTSPDSINISRMSDGKYVETNDGFTRITGWTEKDVIGKTSKELNIWVSQDDRKKLVDGLQKQGTVINMESTYRMKDQTIKSGLMSATIIELNNEPHILSITRDISDLKTKEKELKLNLREKEVMLSELHHRVKNNMQVINGLLQMQIEKIHNAEAGSILKDAQNRINAMATVHNQLYRSDDMTSINIKHLAYHLASSLMQGYGKLSQHLKLDIIGQDEFLPVHQAIPASLILNEIITNAYKYAFPDERKGVLKIEIKRNGKYLFIHIGDDGIGMLPFQKPESGLGSHLIELLTEQLKGKIIRLPTPKGVAYRLKIPIE